MYGRKRGVWRGIQWAIWVGCLVLTAGWASGEEGLWRREPVTISPDSGWCWFQDERAIVDNGRLLASGVASNGDVMVTVYEFATGESEDIVLHEGFEENDHCVPALFARPDGRYLAAYSHHHGDQLMRYRISEEPGNPYAWEPEQHADAGANITYSNLYYLAEEDRLYNFHRGVGWNPNYMISEDAGSTWRYGGQLLWMPDNRRPYPRYAGDGESTIHFVTTDAHPQHYPASVYHGFIRGGEVHASDGTVVGALSEEAETNIRPEDLTLLFEAAEERMGWTSDIRLDAEGRPYVGYIVTHDYDLEAREGGDDRRYHYARWDGEEWRDHEIAHGGTKLYHGEFHYAGLITLHPDDPDQVFISTDVDPDSGVSLDSGHHEIFHGLTDDGGATWTWTAITTDSEADNIRPIVTSGDARGAVVWLRGRYTTYRDYSLEAVGIPWMAGEEE
ncbi:MAG: BNR-4 repeat-containing protein [Candidatus Hydrogenedentota bacterium]